MMKGSWMRRDFWGEKHINMIFFLPLSKNISVFREQVQQQADFGDCFFFAPLLTFTPVPHPARQSVTGVLWGRAPGHVTVVPSVPLSPSL